MKKLRREFHSRSKAFACLLTMCAGFQMPTPLSKEEGPWRLAKRETWSFYPLG